MQTLPRFPIRTAKPTRTIAHCASTNPVLSFALRRLTLMGLATFSRGRNRDRDMRRACVARFRPRRHRDSLLPPILLPDFSQPTAPAHTLARGFGSRRPPCAHLPQIAGKTYNMDYLFGGPTNQEKTSIGTGASRGPRTQECQKQKEEAGSVTRGGPVSPTSAIRRAPSARQTHTFGTHLTFG
jgi:hypothetical protein